MIKDLGIVIGFGDLDAANWNPRIDAVSRCLASWKMRSLSYSGKAIIANGMLCPLCICPVGPDSRNSIHMFSNSFGLVNQFKNVVMLLFKREILAASLLYL